MSTKAVNFESRKILLSVANLLSALQLYIMMSVVGTDQKITHTIL